MSVVSFEDATQHNRALIRKALGGSLYVKPYDEATTPVTKIYSAAGGLIIPPGFVDVGHLTKDQAVAFSREIDVSDVESWGYGEPTRRDITKATTTFEFTPQESKKTVFELYNDAVYGSVVPDADGNLVIDAPVRPQSRKWHGFVLAKDGDGADLIYMSRWIPVFSVTDMGEQSWAEESELQYPMTATAYYEPTWGTAVRDIWGGPGLDAAAMGFTA